jgi:hypothetical protein
MLVQYLLSIALFLEGHHGAIESGHLAKSHAFKVWLDLTGRGLGLHWIETRSFLFHAVEPFWASGLPRCLQGIVPFLKSIGLAPEMALRCRTRRQESGHVSRSVLRTGRMVTLHPSQGGAKSAPERSYLKH